MTQPRPASWFALTADTGAIGAPIAGKHAAMLLDTWATRTGGAESAAGIPRRAVSGQRIHRHQPQRERTRAGARRQLRRCAPAGIRCRCSTANSRPSRPNCRRPICVRRPSCGWSCCPACSSPLALVRAGDRHAQRAATAGEQPAPGAAADHRHSAHRERRSVPARPEPDHRFGLFRRAWKRCSSARTSRAWPSRAC